MSKLYAVYTMVDYEERFLGQAYLAEKDIQAIEQSFLEKLQTEYSITLTDGEIIDVNRIDSVEEIVVAEDE